MIPDQEQYEKRRDEQIARGFAAFMADPIVMATIPISKDNPDLLSALLQSAFKSGYSMGGADALSGLMGDVAKLFRETKKPTTHPGGTA